MSSIDILPAMVESGRCQDKISGQGVLEFEDCCVKPTDLIKWVCVQIIRSGSHHESGLSEDQAHAMGAAPQSKNDIGRCAQMQCNLRQVMKMNGPPHDKCVPKQAAFRSIGGIDLCSHAHDASRPGSNAGQFRAGDRRSKSGVFPEPAEAAKLAACLGTGQFQFWDHSEHPAPS